MHKTLLSTAAALFAAVACFDGTAPDRLYGPRTATARITGLSGLASNMAHGSRIAFSSDRDHPNVSTEIYVMNADGSGQQQLTETPGNSNGPEWSPNGRYISFHSNRGGGVGE